MMDTSNSPDAMWSQKEDKWAVLTVNPRAKEVCLLEDTLVLLTALTAVTSRPLVPYGPDQIVSALEDACFRVKPVITEDK